ASALAPMPRAPRATRREGGCATRRAGHVWRRPGGCPRPDGRGARPASWWDLVGVGGDSTPGLLGVNPFRHGRGRDRGLGWPRSRPLARDNAWRAHCAHMTGRFTYVQRATAMLEGI